MYKDKLVFIGTSIMMLKCIDIAVKDFKTIFVITTDKKIKKKYKKLIKFISINDIKKVRPDYLFSILNNKILSRSHLASVEKYSLNFHDGPLPKYAGMFSSSWAIINNEKTHGVCWHKIVNKIDAGDILEEKKFKIKKNDTAYDIDTKGTMLGINLFKKIIKDLIKNKFFFKKQNLKKRTYFKKNKFKSILKKFKNDKKNKAILKSLILSPQKLKIVFDLFKVSINVNNLKKLVHHKDDTDNKFDKLKASKLVKFLNDTIKTNYKLNEKKSNLSEIALNSHYKWDSLSHVKFLGAIEKKFKITINEKNIGYFSNLKLIFNYLNKKKII